MAPTVIVAARVSSDTKARFRALAQREGTTESALLKRLISLTHQGVDPISAVVAGPQRETVRRVRLSIRLRPEDQLLLRERAYARGMAAATYVSVLVRSHLRSLPPLPRDELLALKRAVAELGAIGRNINQIARGHRSSTSGPNRDDLRAFLKVCQAMRDHVKDLIMANTTSWESGHAETRR